jgi:hypothetical protein
MTIFSLADTASGLVAEKKQNLRDTLRLTFPLP